MALRFLKISSYYRDFLNHYYRQNPLIVSAGYDEQYRHLMDQYFAWSDNYGRILAEKGMETMEIVANASPLQKAWAKENEVSPDLPADSILMQQIRQFRPNVIYFQDSVTYNGSFIKKLKAEHPQLKLCIGNVCAPFSSAQTEAFRAFDYFTVCSPFFQTLLKKYGIPSVNIPHAFDPRILNKIHSDNPYPQTSLAFMGSIFAGEGMHSTRRQILEQLVNEGISFTFYGNLPDRSLIGLLKKQASYLAAHTLDGLGMKGLTDAIAPIRKGRAHDRMPQRLSLSKKLYKMALPPVFGLEMFKALSKAAIGFNNHGDCVGDYAANMRLFETTGVGTCLITDYKSNISDFFKVDDEIVTYRSADECVEKIRWLIHHPEECRQMALRGQQRTLKDHNIASRVELFYLYLMEYLKK
ncbi:glycosyltransferase family protein [Thermophagus sp. OGC60D27]|uniref:glycosyltransferase family protein n=1 Tax=Thermophagus sp. OGC60D27 TaxID=3458415 RepID=UPI0040379F15